jgi:transcriptional repressor NrdR
MVCIYCGKNTSVVNSRYKKHDHKVWRRRLCSECGAILTTFENYDLSTSLLVKKRSGGLQSFSRDKLLISIAKAVEHKKTPSQAASELTQTVLRHLLKNKPLPKIISTQNISDMTSLVLKRYDPASAIKYLSYQNPNQSAKDIAKSLK